MQQIWISAAGLCGASILGSILGFGIKNIPHKWNDIIMGFCAGMMLAAAIIGLILPAADSVEGAGLWLIVAGVATGVAFLNLIDFFTPHLHQLTGLDPETHRQNASINRVLLFVLAIAIHKLPEGIAAGVGFNSTDTGGAQAVALGIAIQNIPEGMVIVAPLLLCGVSRLRTLLISVAIGLLEVAGTWIGYAAGAVSAAALPFMLALAGGAMLYVVSDEMIPETHAGGNAFGELVNGNGQHEEQHAVDGGIFPVRLGVKPRKLVQVGREEVDQVEERHAHGHACHDEPKPCALHRVCCRQYQANNRCRQHHAGAEAHDDVVPLVRYVLDAEAQDGTQYARAAKSGRADPDLLHS